MLPGMNPVSGYPVVYRCSAGKVKAVVAPRLGGSLCCSIVRLHHTAVHTERFHPHLAFELRFLHSQLCSSVCCTMYVDYILHLLSQNSEEGKR